MIAGEKLGGHGERCVAIETLDMAVWDIAAKLEGPPLHALPAARKGGTRQAETPVYAAGGYVYPTSDLARLRD
jgi:L-alanine-DL-glutamate epimerase-like enolase superfamily enzyme